jgi:hypothetical protein
MAFKTIEQARAYAANWLRAKQRRWRQHGNCVSCGLPAGINPATGHPFARCRKHRVKASRYSQTYHKVHGRPERAVEPREER